VKLSVKLLNIQKHTFEKQCKDKNNEAFIPETASVNSSKPELLMREMELRGQTCDCNLPLTQESLCARGRPDTSPALSYLWISTDGERELNT
ncbi:Sperm transmembrane protein 9, partial [Dissostichus eleginoides]